MPRQLPWKGGGSRTQTTKPPSRPSRPTRLPDDFDDDLFEGAALASASSRGKDKTRASSDSDSSLPKPHNSESPPRSKRSKTQDPKEQPTSSSPPPLVDYALPHSEPMLKGVSKFDLRDDEWMMVEDEFLETAKLFTKHLHIAEYDRLKETIEAKKTELALARPVVAGAERSAEGALKEKAKAQEIRQKQAIRDVFASQGDSSEDERCSDRRRPTSKTVKPRLSSKVPSDTDSDDLDARHLPKSKPTAPASASKPPAPVTKPAVQSNPPPISAPAPAPPPFARPALPTAAKPSRPRPNASGMTPFDMLDEYTPPTPSGRKTRAPTTQDVQPRSQSTSSSHSSPRTSEATTPKKPTQARRRSLDTTDDWDPTPGSGTTRKEVLGRIAKRKAERAKGNPDQANQKKKEKTSTQLDDIPTFLF
jgi:hypothetical protein